MLFQQCTWYFGLSIILMGVAIADDNIALCDIEIEGVTVHMSAEEAKAVWASRGLKDVSTQKRAIRTTAFTSAADGMADSIDEFTVVYSENSQGVRVSAQYQGRGGKAAQKYADRRNQFCTPEKMGKKARSWTCFDRLITKGPEDSRQLPFCRYSLGTTTSVVSESVSLTNKFSNTRVDEVTTPTGQKKYIKRNAPPQ